MTTKVIALGNRLMGDDAIAIRVVESNREDLEKKNIEVIIGETDLEYSLSEIFEADLLFILDASYYGRMPGTITVKSIEDINLCDDEGKQFSQHGINLVKLIQMYKLEKRIYIVGIEIHEINYSLDISSALNSKLKAICNEVEEIIFNIIIK